MRRRLFVALGLAFLVASPVYSKDGPFFVQRLAIGCAWRSTAIENTSSGEHLDFLNYINEKKDQVDQYYIALSYQLVSRKKNKYLIELGQFHNLVPCTFTFSASHYNNKFLMLGGGIMGARYSLTDVSPFYLNVAEYPSSYRWVQRKWNITDVGAFFEPVITYNTKMFAFQISPRIGFAGFLPFEQKDLIKYSNSNFKREYEYKTFFTLQPFLMPNIELSASFFHKRKFRLNFLFNYDFYCAAQYICYNQTTYNWTTRNKTGEFVSTQKHWIIKSDLRAGTYISW